MTDQSNTGGAARPTRVIQAEKYSGGVLMGKIQIHAYTKHGSTALVSVLPPESLMPGETLKTRDWILGAKNFIVLCEHKKPMKIPGVWYEVSIVKQAT